jgi:6-pyruvoyltetrahydropterin/6-carboxytetrahydropterin synthase
MFISKKTYSGYSTCFRQWKADGTHCRYLHGYGVSFTIEFQGQLDKRNWVYDFGGFKRSHYKIDGKSPNEYFSGLLDHTVIVAANDPYLSRFIELSEQDLIQLRVLENVGCEHFAKLIYDKVSVFLKQETGLRVKVKSVEFKENERNSAIYMGAA